MTSGSGRLLIVDDNEANRDMLSRRLARRGHVVTVAENGTQALERIGSDDFDLVLLDVMMPDVDGFEVLERVRRTKSAAELPVIMATARDHSEDVVRALELGANDYVAKPLDFPVVLARVQTQLSLQRARRDLERANHRMKRDLEAGARIQRSLIPKGPLEAKGLTAGWRFEPCTELGGDIFDVFPLDDGSLAFYLLDVSGHGVPAALMSVTLARVLSHRGDGSLLYDPSAGGARRPARPAAVAEALNRRFPMDPVTRQYFTLLYAVLDRAKPELRYVAAGHPGPLHATGSREPMALDSGGPAIGWLPDARFEEGCIPLAGGDRVVLYSDGVIEARNAEGEFFGVERAIASLSAHRALPLDGALAALEGEVRAWCAPGSPDDDVSLLAFEVAGEAVS